ncbi:dethiobiotin synthase [Geomonas sp. RF6]|uniref:dethiobiotin synthase n=1 Tax=Geomonas sp. RF6 TaxID=2897342 RepID=UPI001E640AE3|nr:dethiobiotin synthase [Geomonas sp. RF6]UFS70052.1 dethiobiotin synthase [Geomonas sp. RF6]
MRTLAGSGSGRGIFITGTDTGIGKSIVSATLARLLHLSGISVGVMKPVTSGCEERAGALVSLDAGLLCWGAGIPLTSDSAPYLAKAPLAPSVAATLDGITIEPAVIAAAYERLSAQYDFVIVEGAGGLMVPINRSFLMSDLARMLQLPLLVVARPNLGTVNHTLLTTYSASQLGLDVAGVVINRFPAAPDQAEQTAAPLIAELSTAPLLGVFPAVAGGDDREVVEQLAGKLAGKPETERLLAALLA